MTTELQHAESTSTDALRSRIGEIDAAIIALIAERSQTGRLIARVKHEVGLPILDPRQEAFVVRRAAEQARNNALPEEDIREIFWRLITLTRRSQVEDE